MTEKDTYRWSCSDKHAACFLLGRGGSVFDMCQLTIGTPRFTEDLIYINLTLKKILVNYINIFKTSMLVAEMQISCALRCYAVG